MRVKEIPKYLSFLKEYRAFSEMSNKAGRGPLKREDRYPCMNDRTKGTGFDPHYLYHVAWAARVLARTRPEKHIDISSSLNFCTTVSAFVPIEFYDYRPAQLKLDGLSSSHADLMALPFEDGSVNSLSCMHVVEHIGLGRYGDAYDPNGDIKAIDELKRVLAPGGDLLFVSPLGAPRVMFNAHRIYSYDQVMELFSDLRLMEFSLITDDQTGEGAILNASKELSDRQRYGCGCFWFKKK